MQRRSMTDPRTQARVEAWVKAKGITRVAQQAIVRTGVGEFLGHPRIQWKAGEPPSAPAPQPHRKVPATERERLVQYGGYEAVAAVVLAAIDNSALAELARRYADVR